MLYLGQLAVIQSDVRGDVNTDVTWTLSSNPGSKGAILGGVHNRHAVFQASAAGTYTLTATATADPTKTASATIFVTSNVMPTTPDNTEPVDCTAVGSGKVYEVGPARAYADLNAVPWNSVTAGDTVRIHNDDATGTAPTVYRQRISIPAAGNATQPARICGVPDVNGVKPIIDGDKSTTRADANWAGGWTDGLALVQLYDGPHKFDPVFDANYNVIVEGLHIRNIGTAYSFTSQKNVVGPFVADSECIRIQTGRQILIRGNVLENCSEPVFMNSVTPQSSIAQDVTVEGNYLTAWGSIQTVHGLYLQAIGLSVQFNYIDASATNALGNLIKSRSVLNFIRWNYFRSPAPLSGKITSARAIDLVEPQAFGCYIIPHEYAKGYHGVGKTDCLTPSAGVAADPTTPDDVAANFEAYHSDYVYGNIFFDGGATPGFVHYGFDQQTVNGAGFDRRGGTLFYWNNTHFFTTPTTNGKLAFEPLVPDSGHSYEFPALYLVNNVFATSTKGPLILTASLLADMTLDTNWLPASYSLPYKTGNDVYAGAFSAAVLATCNAYNQCAPSNGRLQWARNGALGTAAATLYTGAAPIDQASFAPTAALKLATALPAAIQNQPSNVQYRPASNVIAMVGNAGFLGALDDGTIVAPPVVIPPVVVPPVVTPPAPTCQQMLDAVKTSLQNLLTTLP